MVIMATSNKNQRFRYTEEHAQFVRDNVVNPQDVLADMFYKKFGRRVSVKAISSFKKRLGIRSGLKGPYRKFTDEQLQFIRDNVVNTEKGLTELVNKTFGTNYSVSSISNMKTKLGIHSGLVGGRFQKGQISHNKGKKWDDFMSPEAQANSRKTTFKKGNIPHNHRPVGSERVNVDGFAEVKVAEPNKWKLKHRLLWEEVNGEIPEGYKIIFLDGNRSNIQLSNLEMVKDAEEFIMNQQGLFSHDADMTKSGVLISKVRHKAFELKKSKNKDS